MTDGRIFSAYHIEAPLPSGDKIIPVQVGCTEDKKRFIEWSDNWLTEHRRMGSEINSLYSELSMQFTVAFDFAMRNNDNVGISHYRRLFNPFGLKELYSRGLLKANGYEYGKISRPEVRWQQDIWDLCTSDESVERLSQMLKTDKDIVVLTAFEKTNKWSLWTLADIGWIPVLSVIEFFEYMRREQLNDYEWKIFNKEINESNVHYCNNMLYTNNKMFIRWTAFLETCLTGFEMHLREVEKRTGRQLIVPRMFGYFSEYMLRPWILMNGFNAIEVESICFTDLKTDTRI